MRDHWHPLFGVAWTGLLALCSANALLATDLVVDGGLTAGSADGLDQSFHLFQSSPTASASGTMDNLGDVLIGSDLEVGGQIYLVDGPFFVGSVQGIDAAPDSLEISTPSKFLPSLDPSIRVISSSTLEFVADFHRDTP